MMALNLQKTMTVTSIGFDAAMAFVAWCLTQQRQTPILPLNHHQSQSSAYDIQPKCIIEALKTNRQTAIAEADFAISIVQSP